MNISSIIYGSSARHDNDKYSDKDMLIASTNIDEHVKKLAKSHEATGWNCALYTFDKLDSLAKSGSLFIQHLRQEGVEVNDSCGKLTKIISGFAAKSSYLEDIYSSKKIFDIIKCVEFSPLGILWAIDVIAIGIRNYLILNAAQNRYYEFSYKNLIKNFSPAVELNTDEKKTLLSLRKYKYIFRNNIIHNDYESDLLFKTIDILNNKYCLNISANFVNNDIFFTKQLDNINSGQFSGYQKLRMAESLFLSTRRFLTYDDQKMFYNTIKNPRQCYCFDDKQFIETLIKKISFKHHITSNQ